MPGICDDILLLPVGNYSFLVSERGYNPGTIIILTYNFSELHQSSIVLAE